MLVYWFASWGESMMTPNPHFNAVANSDAELKDFKNIENLTEAAIVRLLSCRETREGVWERMCTNGESLQKRNNSQFCCCLQPGRRTRVLKIRPDAPLCDPARPHNGR